jgi:hypothetical protein
MLPSVEPLPAARFLAGPPYPLAPDDDATKAPGRRPTPGGYAASMRGDLSETAAADACRELAGRGATGAFEVDGPDGPARVLFRDGRLLAAVSPTPRARLGDRLVSAGVLDDAS